MNDNDKKRLNAAFADVDEKYVAAAMTPPRRAHRIWKRFGILAACLALLIGAYFPVRNAVIIGQYKSGAVFVDTEQKGSLLSVGAHKPEAPPLPWDDTLYLKGEVTTRSYEPGQAVELSFEVGLKNDYPGAGSLRLTVKAPDFDIAVEGYECEDGVLTIDHATPERYSAEQPLTIKVVLTPAYEEAYTMGTISLSVAFVPDDGQALTDKIEESDVPLHYDGWQTAFFEDGALRLGSAALDYAADMVELRLDTSVRGAVDVWEIMIGQHYKLRKISAVQLADMYYDYAYRDVISASVTSYMNEEHTVRFCYESKNIRYESTEYLDIPEMWELYEKVQSFENGDWDAYNSPECLAARRDLAEYILLYMREQGIITAEEYESEALWMAQVEKIGNYGVGFDQNLAPCKRVLQKYMYTH